MIIEGEGFTATYRNSDGSVALAGVMRLANPEEYSQINNLLEHAVIEHKGSLTLDIRGLQMLNSSGITMLSKFVINCRNRKFRLNILAADAVAWQAKSLKNLQRLMPTLNISHA